MFLSCFTVCSFFRLSFVLCFVYVEFLLQNWVMLYFSSLFLLYVSALFVFMCFPLCVWLKSVLCFVLFLCFCYVWYVDLFLLCFLLCFHLVLPSCFCLICILLNSDLFSSMILLGFCFYVLWQHQVCSSIGQALEFANSVGFSVGKSAISVPSLEEAFFPHVSTTSIAQTEKHFGQIISGKLKRLLWPPDSASPEYGLVRSFDHLSRDASSQLSKIASAEEMPRATRHLPAWPRLENSCNPRKLFPLHGLIVGDRSEGVLAQSSKCVHALGV